MSTNYRLSCIYCSEVVALIKTVLLVCLVVLAVSGICEIIHSVRLILIRPSRRSGAVCVIWLKKGSAVSQLRFVCEQLRWWGKDFAEHIIAVSSDISGEELETCMKTAAESLVTLCPSDVLESVIASVSANNN